MTKVLDEGEVGNVSEVVSTAVEESGFSAAEAIPGLIEVVKQLILDTDDPDQALTETIRLLEA